MLVLLLLNARPLVRAWSWGGHCSLGLPLQGVESTRCLEVRRQARGDCADGAGIGARAKATEPHILSGRICSYKLSEKLLK